MAPDAASEPGAGHNRNPSRISDCVPSRPDWVPVAPAWERRADDKDIWRRVVTMPALCLNQVERDLLCGYSGRRIGVLGAGDGLAPLALAAMGAVVTVIDPTHAFLDQVLVRSRVTGVNVQFTVTELTDLSGLRPGLFDLCYAAQATSQLADLGRFYESVFRLLVPAGRFIINEYHPFRRIWKQEPGSPRVARSYFERQGWRAEEDDESTMNPGRVLADREYFWTVSDHVFFLNRAGFVVRALEEVGDVRQNWEIPNLRGLPEQLIICADKPGSD